MAIPPPTAIAAPALSWVGPAGSPVLSSLVPSSALSSLTSLANSATAFLNSAASSLPQVPQYFFTVPFANNQAVLYRLRIVSNTSTGASVTPTTVNGNDYIFPLTPSNISKQVINLTNYYDVQGNPNTAQSFGVQRIIDLYGLTPPTITISGTTGFQFHSLDNFQWSGKASFAKIVQIIQNYAQLVSQAANSTQVTQFPYMQFTDGYTGDTFNVVPISQQAFSQDMSRPIYQVYNLQFLAISSVASVPVGIAQQSTFDQAFIATKAILTAGVLSYWNSLLGNLPGGSIV